MKSDDMLSQDEIDALLKGGDDDDNDNRGASEEDNEYGSLNIEDYLSYIEEDALGEVGNISFGSSATALSTLLNQKVDITTPKVSIVKKDELEKEFPQPHVAVQVKYTTGFQGVNLLVIKSSDAAIIADLMLGGDGLNVTNELGELQLSAVQEAMNQMMGSAATSMSTIFSKKVDISPPIIDQLDVKRGKGTEQIPEEEIFAKISFQLKIGELIDSNIMQLLPIDFAKDLVEQLMNPPQSKSPDLEVEQPKKGAASPEAPSPRMETQQHRHKEEVRETIPQRQEQRAVQYQSQRTEPQHIGAGFQQTHGIPTSVQPVAFSSFDDAPLESVETNNLNMLLDIPLQITVELGRTRRTVQEILELSQGSIIELDKLAGEPVDILVNQKLVAKGEVVVIDENFGVRVTDILSQSERMKRLQ